jgi:hypothetical protein
VGVGVLREGGGACQVRYHPRALPPSAIEEIFHAGAALADIATVGRLTRIGRARVPIIGMMGRERVGGWASLRERVGSP